MVLDRHGARWLGAAAGAIGGVSLMILGGLHSLWLVYAVFAFSGLAGFGGGAAGQLLTQVPLAKWFVAQRGRAISIATTGMAIGTVFMIPLTQWLIEAVGWRSTTVILGAFVASVVVPVSILIFRRAPEDMGLFPDGAATRPSETAAIDPRLARLTTTEDWTVQQALRTPALWLMLAAMTLAGVSLMGMLVYRVDFWQDTGMSPALVGLGTALDPLFVVFSLLAFGVVADRLPIRYVGSIGLAGLALSTVPMIISTGQAWTILAHNVAWGISAGGWVTLNSLIWPNYFGRQHLGAIRGIMLPVSIAAASAGPPLFGYLLDGPDDARTGVDGGPARVRCGRGAGAACSAATLARRGDQRPGGSCTARGGIVAGPPVRRLPTALREATPMSARDGGSGGGLRAMRSRYRSVL